MDTWLQQFARNCSYWRLWSVMKQFHCAHRHSPASRWCHFKTLSLPQFVLRWVIVISILFNIKYKLQHLNLYQNHLPFCHCCLSSNKHVQQHIERLKSDSQASVLGYMRLGSLCHWNESLHQCMLFPSYSYIILHSYIAFLYSYILTFTDYSKWWVMNISPPAD